MRLKIGMTRAEREAYCGVRETVFQHILNLLSPLLLLAAILTIALRWHALPQRIPTPTLPAMSPATAAGARCYSCPSSA